MLVGFAFVRSEDFLIDEASQADFAYRVEAAGAEVRRVADARHARAHGFDRAPRGRVAQVFGCKAFILRHGQLAQPQKEIVLDILQVVAQRREFEVRVCVDEAGHDRRFAVVAHERVRMTAHQFLTRRDGDDACAAHGERVIFQNRIRFGHQPARRVQRDRRGVRVSVVVQVGSRIRVDVAHASLLRSTNHDAPESATATPPRKATGRIPKRSAAAPQATIELTIVSVVSVSNDAKTRPA